LIRPLDEHAPLGFGGAASAIADRPTDDLDLAALRKLGVFNYEGFQERRLPDETDFIIPNFLRRRSRNLLVGDSGVGKTPFTADMGIRIAAGVPWLDHTPTDPGTVLYLDGESGEGSFNEMIARLSRHAGLPCVPPTFLFWNPTWSCTPPSANSIEHQMATIIEMARPVLVFVDPLRVYWPHGDGDDSARMIEFTTKLTRNTGCAWIITHHLRKRSNEGRPSLEDDPYAYLQESCGALALVNHSDARVGIEPRTLGEAELVVGGFVRGLGKVGPFHIIRDYDDDGEPQGYRLLSGVEHLPGNGSEQRHTDSVHGF
jgi:hypothetical protein